MCRSLFNISRNTPPSRNVGDIILPEACMAASSSIKASHLGGSFRFGPRLISSRPGIRACTCRVFSYRAHSLVTNSSNNILDSLGGLRGCLHQLTGRSPPMAGCRVSSSHRNDFWECRFPPGKVSFAVSPVPVGRRAITPNCLSKGFPRRPHTQFSFTSSM